MEEKVYLTTKYLWVVGKTAIGRQKREDEKNKKTGAFCELFVHDCKFKANVD